MTRSKLLTLLLGRRWLALAAVLAILVGLGGPALRGHAQAEPSRARPQGQPAPGGRADARALAATENGGRAPLLVLLDDQADLSAAAGMADEDARGWYVYRTLTEHAERTQAGLKAELRARGLPFQAFWAANAIAVDGDRALLEQLAARPDVRRVEANLPSRAAPPVPTVESRRAPAAPSAVEWGVASVNAPQVWALGATGQGIVIGVQDTGMRWDHAALKPRYRGWDGTSVDHNYNWHDTIRSGGGSCGANAAAPCDDQGHGTHVTGTTSGDDGQGNQIGVAPGARWIGCRNMNQGVGTPATYTECFQFFIAPTDLNNQNPDPTRRPHVVNNSWTCPPDEGCAAETLRSVVQSTVAAGIFVPVAAGNGGPSCATVDDPPSTYDEAFTVGAYDSLNLLASFSSRGPVPSSGPRKPNLAAPGVTVRSATRDGTASYGNNNGTSMATPHVSGVVALLWSARPELSRQVDQTRALLESTANPNVGVTGSTTCGSIPASTIPNNHFGYGRVDALAAVNAAGAPTATPTPTATATPTPTSTATVDPSASPTATVTPTSDGATPTATPSPTSSATATSTATATPTSTSTATQTPTASPTVFHDPRCAAAQVRKLKAKVKPSGSLSVRFQAAAKLPRSCGPPTLTWDFGDPASGADTAVGRRVTYTYSTTGTYTATVTLWDAAGSISSRSGVINVPEPRAGR